MRQRRVSQKRHLPESLYISVSAVFELTTEGASTPFVLANNIFHPEPLEKWEVSSCFQFSLYLYIKGGEICVLLLKCWLLGCFYDRLKRAVLKKLQGKEENTKHGAEAAGEK